MSRPSSIKWGKEGRGMAPEWLSERVTLRHKGLRQVEGAPTKSRGVLWEGEVWAMVLTYDQWVGAIGERGGLEGLPMEMRFGVCKSQNPPVVVADLKEGDEVEWSGRKFTITFVEDTAWVDAVMIYGDATE